jgi:tryptophan 6-halogenase
VKKVNSILIVGGGSSGWMTAAYLQNVLRGVDITLVESKSNPIIGVGEATIPFIRTYMSRIGLEDDRAWMPRCDATFKTGILYRHWLDLGDHYWHPLFEDLDYLDPHTHTGHGWLYLKGQGKDPYFRDKTCFYTSCFYTTVVNAYHNRAPFSHEYAYHFDVHLYLNLLRDAAAGVIHVIDDIHGVELDDRGDIAVVITSGHGRMTADLYIDCTGFKRVLIGQVSGAENRFVSFSSSLFCDSALILRMPYESEAEKEEKMNPFVTALAASAGWIWTIPLFSKLSSGYVYCSQFLNPSDAEAELRRHWGPRTDGLESLKLRFATGKLERLWVRNCVAIGLSGGFIEPLESTGLAITQLGVEMLASMLDARYYDPDMLARYNGYLQKFYTDIRDFVTCHYVFTRRTDTDFWKAVRNDSFIPEELATRLDVFRKLLPTAGTKGTAEPWMFRDLSWFSVLLGMGFPFDQPLLDAEQLRKMHSILQQKRQRVQKLLVKLPNHYRYLNEYVYQPNTRVEEQQRPQPG